MKHQHSELWKGKTTKANALEKKLGVPKPKCGDEWLERAKLSQERILAKYGR